MAYIKIKTKEYPISEQDIRNLFPNTSFPTIFEAPEEYANVFPSPQPQFDINTQVVVEDAPTLSKKKIWEQVWKVVPKFQEYIDSEGVTHTVKEQEDAALDAANQVLKDNNVRTAKQLLIDTDFSALVDVRSELQNVAEFDTYRSFLRQIIIDNPIVVETWPIIPTSIWSK
jgi:hypothetical protein